MVHIFSIYSVNLLIHSEYRKIPEITLYLDSFQAVIAYKIKTFSFPLSHYNPMLHIYVSAYSFLSNI